jgi:mannosyl-oligosaccharide glucosidase
VCCCRNQGPYAKECRRTQKELRKNLLSNVAEQFKAPSGAFLWENYDDVDGHGKGTHPFGWTALITLIALEEY